MSDEPYTYLHVKFIDKIDILDPAVKILAPSLLSSIFILPFYVQALSYYRL